MADPIPDEEQEEILAEQEEWEQQLLEENDALEKDP